MENDRVDVKWKQWNKWSACSRAEETPGVIFLITRSCWNAFPFILEVHFLLYLQGCNCCTIAVLLLLQITGEGLIDECECEYLVWLALSFLPHRNSPVVHFGLTGSDWVHLLLDYRCDLKIAFTSLCETQGQIRSKLFSLGGIQKALPKHTTPIQRTAQSTELFCSPLPFLMPSVRWVYMLTHSHTPWQKISKFYLLAQRQFPSKEKKMLRMIGLENP